MFGQQQDLTQQRANELRVLPPKGQPYSVPIPGSQVEGKSAIYRHWRFVDKPLLETLDPAVWPPHSTAPLVNGLVFRMRGADETLADHDTTRSVRSGRYVGTSNVAPAIAC
jgi:hypothetical protein